MNLLIWILFLAAGLLYAIAFFNALIPFLSKRAYEKDSFYKISYGAFFLHTLGLSIASFRAGTLPVSSVFELFIFIAWLVVLIEIVFAKVFRVKLTVFFTSMIAAILILLPLMCPYFNINVDTQIKTSLTLSHIAFAGLSYAFMAMALVLAIAQLLQIRALEKKKNSFFFRHLPSLSSIAKYLFAMETLAAFAMFLSVILGIVAFFVYAMSLSVLYLKFLSAFLVFFLQISFVLLSNKNLIRAKFQAYFAIILFIVALILMFPIDYK